MSLKVLQPFITKYKVELIVGILIFAVNALQGGNVIHLSSGLVDTINGVLSFVGLGALHVKTS